MKPTELGNYYLLSYYTSLVTKERKESALEIVTIGVKYNRKRDKSWPQVYAKFWNEKLEKIPDDWKWWKIPPPDFNEVNYK